MNLHEYQAKQLFVSVGIPVPRGVPAKTPEDAARAYEMLQRQSGGVPFIVSVKAQIHAGGRGKSGGILVARSPEEAATHARSLLGRCLVTPQTGPQGLPIANVLIEEQVAILQERYLALTLDRFRATPILLVSRQGGMDIESLAAADPDAVVKMPVTVERGPTPELTTHVASVLALAADQRPACERLLQGAWDLFLTSDASLIEINPLAITSDGRLLPLDAKVTLDDNALFRHPALAALRDESQEPPLELQASRIGISYVGLEGNIGCLVNGAGLAMATNDIIQLAGGEPANFLDVGGGANVEQVTRAFAIILSDPRVRVVLVNIFGGIMRCDWIAQGLLNAAQTLNVRVPLVVRLQGTNVQEGRRLLTGAKQLNLVSVEGLAEAAERAVDLSRRA